MQRIRDAVSQSLIWRLKSFSRHELYAGDELVATLPIRRVHRWTFNHWVYEGLVTSGDGACEFVYTNGFFKPRYSANASSGSSLSSSLALFGPLGCPLRIAWPWNIETQWSLNLHGQSQYWWCEKTNGQWVVFDQANPCFIKYRSDVNPTSFLWIPIPRPGGQIQIMDGVRDHPNLPLLLFWGWYLSLRRATLLAERDYNIGFPLTAMAYLRRRR